jgi:hypothetical protein
MAIVSSGTVSLLDLQTEFGGAVPISMDEYYAGGTYVPAGTVNGLNAAIPTSGTIGLQNFYGSQKIPVTLPVRALIVGGGGGGGPRWSNDYGNPNGGAGAGGFIDATFNLPTGTHTIIIGGGGGDGNGGDTVAFGFRAYGGGRGGGADDQSGSGGGSGGGGARNGGGAGGSYQPNPTYGSYGTGAPAYGNNGSSADGSGAGAGGGAGSAASSGRGGQGKSWINSNTYAAGGNSSNYNGGPGYDASYYGNGAGGSPQNGYGNRRATSGYQGIVIVSYVWPTQLISGGNNITSSGTGYSRTWFHTITSSGTTITF